MDYTTIIDQIIQKTKLNNNELSIFFNGNVMTVTIKNSVFNVEREYNIPQSSNEINIISNKIIRITKDVSLGKKSMI